MFWTRALGAVLLATIAVGSTAAMAATPDAALVDGSQRLLIASVLVFAAIGFVGYRMAGGYIESLTKHDVEIAPAANDDHPAVATAVAAPTVVVAPITPVVSGVVSPVRGRLAADRFARPITVAPKIPEPLPVQGVPVQSLFMRPVTPSGVASRVEPRRTAPTPVTSSVTPRSGVASPVTARSGRPSPVVSPVQPRQAVERVVARTAPSRSEPAREAVRAEAPARRETVRTAVAP
ncbi:hypothetical protein, partial [Rhodoplanes roseus]